MRLFLNSGHDISNAEDMQSAMQSNGGIRGVATVLCGSLTIPDPKPFAKWDSVSFINDIQMNTKGMKVWRAYGVGDGKEVHYSNFTLKENIELPSLIKLTDVPRDNLMFFNVTPRKQKTVKEKVGKILITRKRLTQTKIHFSLVPRMDVLRRSNDFHPFRNIRMLADIQLCP